MNRYYLTALLLTYSIFISGCNADENKSTSTPLPLTRTPTIITPNASPTLTELPGKQVAYLQWGPNYRYYDSLWLAASDGSSRQVAFDWLGFTEKFAFLPDGSWMLVWISEAPDGYSEKYILASLEFNRHGSCVTCSITDAVRYPPIPSPQGDKIAIITESGLYIANLDGSDIKLLIPNDSEIINRISLYPTWSPDGQYIAVACSTKGVAGLGLRIYRVRRDGTNLVNLTETSDLYADFANPQWSPNGDRIAFVRGDQTIHIMNIDGTDDRVVTKIIAANEVWAPDTNEPPQWSPDGNKLLFETAVEEGGDADIVVVNADGSGWTNLTNTPTATEKGPVWSPDGSQIAFTTNRDGNWEVYVMNADGSNPVNISQSPNTSEDYPRWRP